MSDLIMSSKEDISNFVEGVMNEYVDGFKISENLDNTPRNIGIDSLDIMELQYIVGEKCDLKCRLPENLCFRQIVDFICDELFSKSQKNQGTMEK